MRRNAFSLPVALLAVALTTSLAPAAEAKKGPCIPGQKKPKCKIWTAKVMTVADGDTFNVRIRERGRWSARKDVRLLGVQAMELTDYSRAHGRKGDCHAVAAAERLEDLLQGPKTKRRIVRLASFRNSKTAGARGRLRRGVAFKSKGGWQDAATVLMREGHGLWDPNRKEWAWNKSLSRLAAEAAKKGIGIWDSDSCGAGPAQDIPIEMKVKWDANGTDGKNVNGEWVRIRNMDPARELSLRGWSLRDAYLRSYFFPNKYEFPKGAVVAPGDAIRVHVGKGRDDPDSLFWGEPDPIFENAEAGARQVGDGAYLFDPQGDLRASSQYPCRLDCAEPLKNKVEISAHRTPPESITITNTSTSTIDLSEYEVETSPWFYEFNWGTFLRPGLSIVVVVDRNPSRDTPLMKGWGMNNFILADKKDVVTLRNPTGAPVVCKAWGRGMRCPRV